MELNKKFEESGTLVDGIEFEGVLHKDFVLGETTVADTVSVYDDPAQAK
jgi:hypothetical protein